MKTSITLTQLEYALAVKTHGSFSAAAKACHVSQPALSEMIHKLEQAVGVILFDRKQSPIGVTEVGRDVLEQARRALDEAQRVGEIADEWKGQVRGVLRIGLIPTLAPALIPIFLKSMRAKYPEVALQLTEAPTDQLLVGLQSNELDVALLSTPADAPGHFVEKPLFYEPFRVYASRGSALLKRKSLELHELENENLILMDESHCARDQVLSICRKQKHGNQTTVKGGLQTLISVVDHEDGFTLIPELLSGLVTKSQLRELEAGRHTRKISMLINKAHLKKKLIELLAAEILDNLPAEIHLKREPGMKVVPPDAKRFA